jgi:hypothetical protein
MTFHFPSATTMTDLAERKEVNSQKQHPGCVQTLCIVQIDHPSLRAGDR